MKRKWLAQTLVYLSLLAFFSWLEWSFYLYGKNWGLVAGNTTLALFFLIYKVIFWCGEHWNDEKKI